MRAEINGRKRRLPVMGVDNVRREQIPRNGQRSHGEDSKTNIVIRMIDTAGGIDPGPVEQWRTVDEVKGDAAFSGLIQVRHETWTDWYPEISISDGGRIRIHVVAVIGNHDGDLFAFRRQGRR